MILPPDVVFFSTSGGVLTITGPVHITGGLCSSGNTQESLLCVEYMLRLHWWQLGEVPKGCVRYIRYFNN